ncbi:steroid 5-alpha-reductase DET2-like isoform X1 [Mizuhopecten yessoensis]|uniref:steroid 5-alpha-reductase DET2-like isoform X1 n=1 Tax=Mizuhopecten yessoensis TaxID=6573 RepID=UPI000B45D457|nr:steroid 5-alpha-reductase DET2-like isoform X1 [Mizuhopecten yessoensis]
MSFQGIPWILYEEDSTRFWVHYGLVILGFVLAVVTAVVQWINPAPYGKHENKDLNWGPMIPQRLGHILSDATPGVLLFLLVFFLYGGVRRYTNYVFLAMFLCHYVQRGIIHPLIMNYRSAKVPIGITLGGFFPNCIYHFINADFVGSAVFNMDYFYDPRFIIGILLFLSGFIINRWADWKLKSLRNTKGEDCNLEDGCNGYYIPYGGLFELVTCPNYFGELVEWLGWAIATWSLPGLVWCLFSAATFVPRSQHNHKWYKQQFELYPRNRKALIPYIF